MIYSMISGVLHRPAEQRTSKAGKAFVTATVRVKDGDATTWWKVVAFSESVQAELMRLCDGDAVSLQGSAKVEIWQPEAGEPRLNFSLIADQVIALRAEKKKPADDRRPSAPPRERQAPRRDSNGLRYYGTEAAVAGLDDSMPF